MSFKAPIGDSDFRAIRATLYPEEKARFQEVLDRRGSPLLYEESLGALSGYLHRHFRT
jgi:hypothetical protein